MGKGKQAKATKRTKKAKNPDGPKKPKSAFMFYSQERRLKLKDEQPSLSLTDASKVIGAEWKQLTDAEKAKFNESAEQDKKRYADEKEAKASA